MAGSSFAGKSSAGAVRQPYTWDRTDYVLTGIIYETVFEISGKSGLLNTVEAVNSVASPYTFTIKVTLDGTLRHTSPTNIDLAASDNAFAPEGKNYISASLCFENSCKVEMACSGGTNVTARTHYSLTKKFQ